MQHTELEALLHDMSLKEKIGDRKMIVESHKVAG